MTEVALRSSSIEDAQEQTAPSALSIHKYLPLAILYFFFNSFGLPVGLFYTTLLSPLFFVWLFLEGKRWLTLKLFLVMSPFLLAHAVLGIDSPTYYARSAALMWTAYITVYAFCWALLKCKNIDRLFEELIVLNFCASIAAVALLFTPLNAIAWHDDSLIMPGASSVLRLRLLSSEPSVYANLMVPLLLFAVLRLFQKPTKRSFYYAAMIIFPFLLCQSFGGIAMCVAGLGVAMITAFRHLFKQRRTLLILALVIFLVAGLLAVPNPISERVFQAATGTDSSTNSRTTFSFIVAYAVAESKSLWWGKGLGQGKLYDVSDLGLGFTVGIIPNAVAGTFAELGIIGVLVKFSAEFYLFFRTRVFANPFRLAIFIVAFIAQLTGSYLMNVQEYLMWCFAFAPFFPTMDLHRNSSSKTLPA